MTSLPPRGTPLVAPSDEGFVGHDDGTFDVWSEVFEEIDQAALDELDRERDGAIPKAGMPATGDVS